MVWSLEPDGRIAIHATHRSSRSMSRMAWMLRRIVGKPLTVLRWIKAFFVFEGGVDYALWKLERHTGVRLALTPWQRRHPLLAFPAVVMRLYRQGALR
jgi:hypothetical protein